MSNYLALSRDFVELVRRPEYQHLTQKIDLRPVQAYEPHQPAGSLKECYAHSEIQLILFYERYPPKKNPRAIGCSKSACYLCNSLIQRLGYYRISYTHGRLFSKWYVPEVELQRSGSKHLRSALESIMKDMDEIQRDSKSYKPYPLQSRPIIPLSIESDLDSSSNSAVDLTSLLGALSIGS